MQRFCRGQSSGILVLAIGAVGDSGCVGFDGDASDDETDVVETDTDVVERDTDLVDADTDLVDTDTDLVDADTDLVDTDTDLVDTDTDLVDTDTVVVETDTSEPETCVGDLDEYFLPPYGPYVPENYAAYVSPSDLSSLDALRAWQCAADATVASTCPLYSGTCTDSLGRGLTFVRVLRGEGAHYALYDQTGALITIFVATDAADYCGNTSSSIWLGEVTSGCSFYFPFSHPDCGTPLVCLP